MSETVGNAAAMREALEKVAVSSEYALKHDDLDCGDLRGFIEEMGQDARAALAAPPRQCDVGTAEEQAQRFEKFCKKSSMSSFGASAYCAYECACKDCSCCELAWAQMPYAEEGGAK